MLTQEIEAALAERYKGNGWAKFFQFMPMTSFEATLNQIDLLVVGLWRKHDKIIAFEIKVQRSDFLKDLKEFKKKHRFALRISDEFYYICPWALIEKEEVPEDAGLMYVNKNSVIKIIKPALMRTIHNIPFRLFQGFAREFGNKIDHTKIPVKYLGKDMTQDDLMEIIKKEREWSVQRDIEQEAKKLIEEKERKEAGRDQFMRELMKIGYGPEGKEVYSDLLKYCKLGKEMSADYGFISRLKSMKEEIENVMDIINKKRGKK